MNTITTNQDTFFLRRNRLSRKATTSDKIQSLAGSVAGTVIPMAFMMKKQGVKNPLKLTYGLGEMLLLTGSSIVGGVAVGMLGNNKRENKSKVKEGVFQFLNAAIPTWLSASALRLCETTPKLNNIPTKIFSALGAILTGMYGAAALSNIICDPKDRDPDRKLSLKDSLANLDDMVGVLVLGKFPLAEKLHIEKILPAIYTYCGYRAGKSN